MREIRKIIVHCSASPPSMNTFAKDIDAWHKLRGWSGIGYHYVIRRSGILEKGRDIMQAGAHAKGYNFSSVGVCLIGGVDEEGKADANYTLKQYNTLLELIRFLEVTFPIEEVMGHRDLPNVKKTCPCFDVRAFIKQQNRF